MAAASGGYHSAAVGEDGSLFVWGDGSYGQLGTGDTAERLAPTRKVHRPFDSGQAAVPCAPLTRMPENEELSHGRSGSRASLPEPPPAKSHTPLLLGPREREYGIPWA